MTCPHWDCDIKWRLFNWVCSGRFWIGISDLQSKDSATEHFNLTLRCHQVQVLVFHHFAKCMDHVSKMSEVIHQSQCKIFWIWQVVNLMHHHPRIIHQGLHHSPTNSRTPTRWSWPLTGHGATWSVVCFTVFLIPMCLPNNDAVRGFVHVLVFPITSDQYLAIASSWLLEPKPGIFQDSCPSCFHFSVSFFIVSSL